MERFSSSVSTVPSFEDDFTQHVESSVGAVMTRAN